ncbi:MAG: phosphoribosyltransferase family protein [Hyphomicrobium sp.]|uniref:phosphoribosyltransferase family protein n=1 Tax=Hyphomicrobium sp. TaxID=82 RepID=UPI0035642553
MKELIKAFHNQPLRRINGREYILNPLLDHYPETSYALMEDTILELSRITDLSKIDKIVGEEDRGGYIAALMAFRHKKSLAMVKWNPCGLDGHIGVDFRNAYTSGKMYLNGAKKGDKVLIVEDLIDSGGTIIAMISLLKYAGVEICDIITVVDKVDYGGRERILKETGFSVKNILGVACRGGRSKVISVLGIGT